MPNDGKRVTLMEFKTNEETDLLQMVKESYHLGLLVQSEVKKKWLDILVIENCLPF